MAQGPLPESLNPIAMRIGIDAMGGDFAPRITVAGTVSALSLLMPDSTLVLFGDQKQIEALLPAQVVSDPRIEVVDASEVIEMGESPAQAFGRKSNSSIAVGFQHLQQGLIDGFASAGNTGAMLVGAMATVKQIEGLSRPGIASSIKTISGSPVTILDVGLNVDCKPEVLFQYGILGSIYARQLHGIENPRVALLNIGEEPEKGNIATKTAYPLMQESKQMNFVGNIEASHILNGDFADVIVCDGFVGNTIIKQYEGIFELLVNQGVSLPIMEGMNYENVGGTPVLGVNANVIIGHGKSSQKAIVNMILQTEKTIAAGLVTKFKEAFN